MASQLEQREQREADLLTISVFTSLSAICLALIYAVARIGFENLSIPVVSTLGLALLVLNVPVTAHRWLRDRGWISSPPTLLISTVLVLALVGLLPLFEHSKQALPLASYLLAALGAGLFGASLVRWLRRGRLIASLLMGMAAGVLAAWAAGVMWDGSFRTPLILERVSFQPVIGDVMFHGAVVGMLETYGTVSTGFHGLVPLHYHIGSHLLFMPLARLMGLTPLHFYQLGFPVLIVPVFWWSLLCAMLMVRAAFHAPIMARPLRSDAAGWLTFILLNVGLVEQTLIYVSESFMVGITVLALTIGLCAEVINTPAVQRREFNSASLRVFVLIALPLLGLAMGVSKLSLICVFIAICGYFFVRWGLFRHMLFIAGMVSLLAVFAAVYRIVNIAPQGHPLVGAPLQTIFNNFPNLYWPFYYVMYYAYAWVFIVLKLAVKAPRTLRDLWQQVADNELVDVEIVAITALASALPGMVGVLFGEFWFALIQRWVALIFLIANLPLFMRWLSLRTSGGLAGLNVRNLVIALALAVYLLAAPYELFSPIIRFAKDNLYSRQYFTWQERDVYIMRTLRSTVTSGDLAGTQALMREVVIPFLTTHYQYTEQDPRYQLLHTLEEIGRLPASEKRGALIFIPKSNVHYWGLPVSCDALPMLAQSLTGMPALQGIPPTTCEITTYGYVNYAAIERHDYAITDQAAMCAEARSLGFGEVWVIGEDAVVKKVVCDQ